ncbi:hypothetical protein [Neptuniibacter halophilus]|uniref:hypothetical protein n=1 Tax=Neptuniibacter halophilus TaxID=651666 RepID=UPI002573C906|nr:hypothetical protein [Neptuniibacter halophilus]
MAQSLQSVSLTSPASDPNIDTGNSFTMSAAMTWGGGHGGNETVELHFEYSSTSGGPYADIPVSGSELTTSSTNPVSVTSSPASITVSGSGAGTYYVRARGIGGSTFSSAEQVVTVNQGAITGSLNAQESGSDTASASGSVLLNGSLAVQESGADTALMPGTVLIDGSLAAQENGADIASFNGTVSDPAITGALSAQESGTDAAAFSGSATVTGTFSVQDGPADSASLSGSVDITGGLSAQESGGDSASITGGVSNPGLNGALLAQESGSDTAGLSGSVEASGSVAVQESGSDIAIIAATVTVSGTLSAQGEGSDAASINGSTNPGVSGGLSVQESGSDIANLTGSVTVNGAFSAQESGGLPPGNWVDIDDPVTIQQIADEVVSRFNFNGQGDVLATLDDEQVNVKGVVGNSGGAGLTLQTGGVSKEMEKQLKSIGEQLAQLSTLKPDERIDAIQQAIKALSFDLTPAIDAVSVTERRVEGRITEAVNDITRSLKALPQPADQLQSIEQVLAGVTERLEDVGQAVASIEIPEMPEAPSIDHLATSDQVDDVGELVYKLHNFDDSGLRKQLKAVLAAQGTINEQLQIIKRLQVSGQLNQDYQ